VRQNGRGPNRDTLYSIAWLNLVPEIAGTRRGQDPLSFFDALGDALKRFPPPAADHPFLAKLRAVGIGAGLHPRSSVGLDAATRQGLHDADGSAGP
jgi:hypothetical protein